MKTKGPESENAERGKNIGHDDLNNSSAPQPAPQQPVVAEPVSAQPIMAHPVAAQPVTAQPVMAQPIPAQPVIAQPIQAQSVSAQPVTAQQIAAPYTTTFQGAVQAVPQSQITDPPESGTSLPFSGFIFEEEQTKLARFIEWFTFKKKVIGFITSLFIVAAIFVWSHPEIVGGSTDKIEVLASHLGGSWAINENNFQGKMVFTPGKKDPIFGNYRFFDNEGTPIAEDSYQVLHTSEKDYLELALTEAPEVFQIIFKSRNEITLVTNDEISINLTRDD